MDRRRFSKLARQAVEELPEEYLERLDNVEIVIEDWPSRRQLRTAGLGKDETLYGLYEGVPLTERTTTYGLVPPDKITIFQGPIEADCVSDDEIIEEVGKTVQHEIAHFFGISDERLDELDR